MLKRLEGFTLVELAIVLVIIGLLVGGVLQGQELIKQAKISSTISQMNDIRIGKGTFQAKYNALPGDLKKTEIFNIHRDSSGNINSCRTGSSPIIYDGDGNGALNDFYNAAGAALTYTGESPNFLFHLANLGLIKNGYRMTLSSDNCSNASDVFTGDVEYPLTRIEAGMVVLSSADQGTFFVLGFGSTHEWRINHLTPGNAYSIAQNTLSPETAYAVDAKLDDGKPTSGVVFVTSGYDDRTVSPANSDWGRLVVSAVSGASSCINSSQYNLSYTQTACTLAVKM